MDDERFTIENIQAAVENFTSTEPTQESIDFLTEWQEQIDSILTSLELCQTSPDLCHMQVFSQIPKNKIADYWAKYSPEQKDQIKQSLISLVAMPELQAQKLISFNFIYAICQIGVYNWPEEWPDFSVLIHPQPESPTCALSLKIFAAFLKMIQGTHTITENRRNQLRLYFGESQKQNVLQIITQFIGIPELTNDSLLILNYILKWSSLDDVMSFELLQQLALNFLTNTDTVKNTVKCLTSIFIGRTDSSKYFDSFAPFLARALAQGEFQSGQPITNDQHVLQFLISFIHEYSAIFELVFSYDTTSKDEQLKEFIDVNVRSLILSMASNGVSPQDLYQDVTALYGVILSIPCELIHGPFWQLWDNNLRRVVYEMRREMASKPASNFFLPMMPIIRESLIKALPASIDENSWPVYQARTTMSSLVLIDSAAFMEYLNQQEPSPTLCLAIGMIEFTADDEKTADIAMIAAQLLEHAKTEADPEFHVALLFGLSHSSRYYQGDSELFSKYIEYVISSITNPDESVRDAAVNSLYYIVQRRAELFKGENRTFAELLISQSETYLQNLSRYSAIRIFKICTWLIAYNKPRPMMRELVIFPLEFASDGTLKPISETPNPQNEKEQEQLLESIKQMFAELFQPIIAVLTNPDQFAPEIIETTLDIVRECSYASVTSVALFSDLLLPPLYQIAQNSIPNPEASNEQLQCVIGAIASMQVSLDIQDITEPIQIMLGLMQSRGTVENCFFEYFSIVRNAFPELDELYPTIHESLVLPALSAGEDGLSSAMYDMFTIFSPGNFDIEWLTSIILAGISDLRSSICISALSCFQSFACAFSNETFLDYCRATGPQLLDTIISSILDLVHKLSFNALVEALRLIISRAGHNFSQEDIESVKGIIVESFKRNAQEPEEGFFDNFVAHLFSIKDQIIQFRTSLANLLIVMRKACPGDAKLFQVKPVMYNSLFSLIFDSLTKSSRTPFELRVGPPLPLYQVLGKPAPGASYHLPTLDLAKEKELINRRMAIRKGSENENEQSNPDSNST